MCLKKKKYWSFLLTLLCFILGGCNRETTKQYYDDLPIMKNETESVRIEPETIGIYTDVTPSMAGFLGMEELYYKEIVPETRYVICLQELNAIIASAYDEQKISYYRVDTPLWKSEENVLHKATEKNFYTNSMNFDKYQGNKIDLLENDGEGYESLCLTNTLYHCMKNDFSVVITDLYENTGVSAEVIQALKDNVQLLGKNPKTIGIIGFKSEFAGTIYDLSMYADEVEYGIVKEPMSREDVMYRQFYVLVIGEPQEVSTFCKKVVDNMELSETEMQYTIFYESEICGLDYTDFDKCRTRINEKKEKLWANGIVKMSNGNSMSIYDYYTEKEDGRDIVVTYKVEGATLRAELEKKTAVTIKLPDCEEKKLIPVSCSFGQEKIAVWNQDGFVDENIEDVFQIKQVYYSLEEEVLYVWFHINKIQLSQKQLRLQTQIYLLRTNESDSSWCTEWDLGKNEADLGKTRYLQEYVWGMEEKLPPRENVLIDFVFYINCK